jgi:hypothetical protein
LPAEAIAEALDDRLQVHFNLLALETVAPIGADNVAGLSFRVFERRFIVGSDQAGQHSTAKIIINRVFIMVSFIYQPLFRTIRPSFQSNLCST